MPYRIFLPRMSPLALLGILVSIVTIIPFWMPCHMSREGEYISISCTRMAGTRFIRPALFHRTMFEGGPTLDVEGGSNYTGYR